MRLLLDVGNTRIKWAQYQDGELGESQALVHVGHSRRECLEEIAAKLEPSSVWVSCVAGADMQESVFTWADETWGIEPDFIHTTAEACGVTNAYAKPEKLGVDRWLAVIAAHHRGKGAACVVDAGTCLTFDVVDAKGKHLGGLIAPGVASQRSAVWGKTQVRAQPRDEELTALAVSTDAAVSFGTLHGPLGLVERVLQQVQAQVKVERLLLTGGEVELLASYLPSWEVVPDLVLEGIAHYSDHPPPLLDDE
ncbi:MAG: type III pantothenate kinase [Salinisphaeraceae bacterium]|nr:type III pantothenate kinase [Salinisphaeraceae bacterium]